MKYDFIEGFVLTNTTIYRENLYKKQSKDSWKISEEGGLSGPPLKEKANDIIKTTYQLTDGKVLIIGVGGISCGKDAFEKISLGTKFDSDIHSFNIQRSSSSNKNFEGIK